MRVGVLGPLEIDGSGARLGTRDRVVLSALAMKPGELLSQEQLADAVWGESPPATWSKSLQGCISRLRKLLGTAAIETSAHGYRLRLPSDSVDVGEFDRETRRAEELLALGEYERVRYVATQGLALWRGRPLAELEQWEAGCVEAGRLTELRFELEEIAVQASLASGHHREVLAQAAAMVEAAPLRERRWSLLARAQYQAGQQTEALRTLRRIRVILQQELGLDPSPELTGLEEAILRQDSDLLVTPAGDAQEHVSPYQGLASYGEADAESFFGRDEEIRSCVERLRTVSLLSIVGPSGSGKSSLLRAGLASALRRDGARVVVMTPGLHPMDTLASARPRVTSVILVDQAEETFSLCLDEEERRLFFDALVAHTERGSVVLAIRGDYTGELADHPALAALVERGLFLLGAMSDEGLRAAIERPARQHGLLLEPGLTDLLVREVEGEPGALPLLSHALRETWLHHEGRTLTVAGYQASGGIRGAVAQSAEALYGNLPDSERADLRELVLRLVVPGPEGEPVRNRIPRQQAIVTLAQGDLIERMVAARLVTSGEGDVELAHEALVRAWPRLRGWLEDDLEGQRTRHRLTLAAGDWDALGRLPSELYRGARLIAVSEWVNAAHPQLTRLEQQFLDASAELAAVEEQSAREQVRRERHVNRRLRALAGGLALLVVVSLVTGFLAVRQTRSADRASLAADARRVGTAALLEQDPRGSLMKAVAAARLDPSVTTGEYLQAAIANSSDLVRTTNLPASSTLSQVLATPAGLVVSDRANQVQLLHTTTLGPVTTAQVGHANGNSQADVSLTSSSSEHVLAVSSQQPNRLPVRLLDPATLRLLPRQLHGWPTRSVTVTATSVSGNGRYLTASLSTCDCTSQAEGWVDTGPVRVWDLHTRKLVRAFRAHPFSGVALDRTGRHLFLTSPFREYDVHTGRVVWSHGDLGGPLGVLQPGGRLLATADPVEPTNVQLRRAGDGRLVATLRGLQRPVSGLEFSHDGSLLAAGGDDGLGMVWNVHNGDVMDRIEVGGQQVTGLSFSSDDHTLYTAAEPGHQLSVWNLTHRQTYLSQVPSLHAAPFSSGNARISHDGTRILDMGRKGKQFRLFSASIVDRRSGKATDVQTLHTYSYDASSWSPDDRVIALGYPHGIVTLVDGTTGRIVTRQKVLDSIVTEVSFSADGRYLLATDLLGDAIRVDPHTLAPPGQPVRVPEHAYAIAASQDGRYGFVLAGGTHWEPYLSPVIDHFYVVDLQEGRIVRGGDAGVHNAFYADFSPDGRHVTVGGRNGEVAVIDVTTGTTIRPTLPAYSGTTVSVRYNRDGSRVTTSSGAGDLALLDGRTGTVLATAAVPPAASVAVSNFMSDGRILVATFSGKAYIWDPSTASAIRYACSVTGRGLTPAEWANVFPGRPWRQTCPT